ncbi:MAG: SpoIIE family protein phosphatase [Planctomycetes bacterium]|nr:SpoIIE family protein phosphatase [Planctomycetota bacterium]
MPERRKRFFTVTYAHRTMKPRALDIKLLILVIAILSGGMGLLTYVNILRHEQDLMTGVRTRIETVADSLRAGISSIMRTGDVCRARDYVRDLRSVEGIADLKIYNARGGEAYRYPASVSALAAADQNVTAVLESGRPVTIDMADGKATAITAPLLNEPACHRCHGADRKMRGAFSIAFRIREQEEATPPVRAELMRRSLGLLSDTILCFYESLMLSDLAPVSKDFIRSLMLVPGIERVTVYDAEGKPKFSTFSGRTLPALRAKEREELLGLGRSLAYGIDKPNARQLTYLQPITNKQRCQACHDKAVEHLGVMALTMNASGLSSAHAAGNFQNVLADTMVALVTRCLQEVMKVAGIAPVRTFAQQFHSLPEVTDLKIFGPKGHEVFPEKMFVEEKVQKVFATGRPREAIEENNEHFYLTLLKPIFNGNECRRCHGNADRVRAVIAVSVSLDQVRERITRGKMFSVLAASGTMLLVCILIVGFIEVVIVRPIRRIGEVADRVGAGNLNLRADDRKQDEFGRLARRMNSMIEGLTEKQRIEQALRIARDIQRSHLPKRNPELPGLDVAGWSLPAEETGGDYYDFLATEDGKLLVVLADVASHGIGPALIMSQTRALVRAALLTVKDISRALCIVNSQLCADLIHGRFVTLFIAEIDPETRLLRYVSAGHNPPMVLNREANRTVDLNTTGVPLGIDPQAKFEAGPTVQLHAGDVILLATDGASEMPNGRGERFGRDSLREQVFLHSEEPAQEIVEAVSAALKAFRDGAEQRDDLTMVVIRVTETSGDQVRSL